MVNGSYQTEKEVLLLNFLVIEFIFYQLLYLFKEINNWFISI